MGVVPLSSRQISRVLRYSGSCWGLFGFAYGAFTLSRRSFQFRSASFLAPFLQSLPLFVSKKVWAPSVSLAATSEIDVSFFSSGYLDVSVRRVPLPGLSSSSRDDWPFASRVSPFRYLRLSGYLLLPAAFRSLSRLSSALSAKASALCSFLLDLSHLYSVINELCMVSHALPLSCTFDAVHTQFLSRIF